MKKILPYLFVVAALFAAGPSLAWAHSDTASPSSHIDQIILPIGKTHEVVTIGEDEVIDKDFYFTAGQTVEIFGTINGDLYVGGGQVIIGGTINGDVYVAGGMITITGEVAQDVLAFGGQVDINGTVGENLTTAGGNITISPEAIVQKGAIIAGGNVNVLAPINGDLAAGVGNLVISNSIGGDVYAGVGEMRLTSKAGVAGDITYTSEEELELDPAATIGGEIFRNEPPVAYDTKEFENLGESFTAMFTAFSTIVKLFRIISWAIIGIILLALFPNWAVKTQSTLSDRGWASLGVGFAALIATPVAILFLFITLLGAPVGFLLLLSYMMILCISRVVTANWLGALITNQFNWSISPIARFLIGLLVLGVSILLPFIGGFVSLLSLIVGMGSLLITEASLYKSLRKGRII